MDIIIHKLFNDPHIWQSGGKNPGTEYIQISFKLQEVLS